MSEYTAELSEALFLPDATEPHIVIAADRSVIVPDELKNIAVQFDHNVETVTFDCPRYWDEHDLSTMHIYVNYRCADGKCESYVCNNPVVDENDETIIHFDWTVSRGVTCAVGTISFLVCAKTVGSDGNLQLQWSSSMNQEMVVSEGLDPDPVDIDEETSDLIEYLLTQMTTAVNAAGVHAAAAQSAASVAINAAINATEDAEKSIDAVRDEKINDIKMAGTHEVDKIHEAANERLGDFDAVGAVRFDRQVLDDKRKEQAKANIDAGGAIVCEASGETVTIADASDQPLRGLKLYGKSVQNGTPTPENPVEIENVGDGGSVLAVAGGNNHFAGLEYSWTTTNATEYKFSDNNNFTITYKGGTGSIQIHCMLDATIYRGKAITLSWGEWIQSNPAVIGRVFLQVYGANSTLLKNKFVNSKSGIKSLTIDVVPKEAVSIMLLFRIFQDDEGGAAPSVGNSAQFVNVQLGIGSEPKAYEPGNTPISATISTPGGLPGIPVSSGGNYTDANGQRWICDEMDFARGVYVQRVGKVDLGTLSWVSEGKDSSGLNRYASGGIVNLVMPYTVNYICTHYPVGFANNHTNGIKEIVIHPISKYVTVFETYETPEALKTSLSGVMFYYELATPVETPISETDLTAYRTLHTNKPNTTVYTDSNAGLTVAYAADTKTYIDNKFAELAAAVLQNA